MGWLGFIIGVVACTLIQQPHEACWNTLPVQHGEQVAGAQTTLHPQFRGPSLDVVLSAESAIAWDVASGEILYEKAADERRPVSSISKLLTVLTAREHLALTDYVTIPNEAASVGRRGANIKLTPGSHANVEELMAASLVASANDAAITLAVASAGSEQRFAEQTLAYAHARGIYDTKLSNATGFSGGDQFSTAQNVRRLLLLAYRDPVLNRYLSAGNGVLTTQEGQRHQYKTTNKILGSYLPVLAAKTGYTDEAGENFTMITKTKDGHEIGAAVLASDNRFHDMKVLIEWLERNYEWR